MSEWLKAGGPIPADLGRCVDLYHDVRELRLSMAKEVEEMERRERELREHVIQNLPQSSAGVMGLRFKAVRKNKRTYRIGSSTPDDMGAVSGGWGALTSWIRKNDRFDMLQKRLSDKAVADFATETGRLPPGVDAVDVPDISVTKV